MVRTTVVIPNYNGIQYMDACLASLRKGTTTPEILVVDNGSVDGSKELVKERYPGVRLLEFEENTGFCRAVNAGIRASTTEFVLLLNNDTVAEPEMVERLEQALEGNRRVFSAQARMIQLHSPDKLDGAGDLYCALGWAFCRGKDGPVSAYEKPCRVFSACAGAAIYRRALFDEIGCFDENHFAYLEDTDIGYRANIYGYHNKYVPDARVYHAGSAVSGSRHNDFKVKLSARNNIYLIYKNMPALQILLNLPFLLAGWLIKLLFFSARGLCGAYLDGSLKGLRLCAGGKGRKHRVRFRFSRMKNYFWIQGQLWVNIFRRLRG